jgi:hypothetical protein
MGSYRGNAMTVINRLAVRGEREERKTNK